MGCIRGTATSRASGFTLVELVTVLIIVGVVSVFVAPRLNTTGFSQYSFHQELLAAMRHAQKTANATGCEVRVDVNASTDSYNISFTGDSDNCADTTLSKPGGSGPLTGAAPDDVDIDGGADFVFDGFGVADGPIEVTLAGGRRVVVEARTGHVHD